MSRSRRAAGDLLGAARNHIATCLDLPVPEGDAWEAAGRDIARASRDVGQSLRSAMKSVDAELAPDDA